MTIKDWPADDRPREKLLKRGATALTDAELLAIFLRTGIAGQSAVDLSRALLTRFSGLAGLLHASRTEFCEAKGLGDAKYAQLQAVLEMSKRHIAASVNTGQPLNHPHQVFDLLSARLRGIPHEVFLVLFLDTRHTLIASEELARGTLDGAAVYPREIVRAVMRHNAAAVIFAHNHPSGIAEPSQADRRITERLEQALRLIDVRVLDHVIIGSGAPVSFAERGLL